MPRTAPGAVARAHPKADVAKKKPPFLAATKGGSEDVAQRLHAALVEPLPFMRRDAPRDVRVRCASALRTLRHRGLPNRMIRDLVRALTLERARDVVVDGWPAVSADRTAIARTRDACKELAVAVSRLSPKAEAEVATAALLAFGKVILSSEIARAMTVLAIACEQRLEVLPAQTRRTSYPNVIAAIVRVVAPLELRISPRNGTKFHDVCAAAFALGDITARPSKVGSAKQPRTAIADPTPSIRAFQETTGTPQ